MPHNHHQKSAKPEPELNKEEQVVEQAAEATEAQPEVNPLEELVRALAKERDQLKDQMLRAMAEAQTIQRRLRQQMEADRKYALEPLVRDLLPVLDNFERSLDAAEKSASFEKLIEGVKAVEKQLRGALDKANVSKIPALGLKFNPEVHEALDVHETDEHEDETVTQEIQPGYTLHDKVIRPARVRVSKKP